MKSFSFLGFFQLNLILPRTWEFGGMELRNGKGGT